MFLKESFVYCPNKYAFTIGVNPLAVCVHANSQYFAYATRQSEVILHNRKYDRSSILFKSKSQVLQLMFTQQYLIVIEKNTPQLLVFSLKTQKLKKKISGHRSQVVSISYCAQRACFCSASHDVCIIWDQSTLNSLKILKCSTSAYVQTQCSDNGQYLFTSFADGSIFAWDLDSFESKQASLTVQPYLLTSSYNQFIVAYTKGKVLAAQFSSNKNPLSLHFEEISSFWEGSVHKIGFLENYMFLKTSKGFYMCQMYVKQKISIKNAKKLIDPVQSFIIGQYGGELIIINKDLTKIQTMQILQQPLSEQVIPLNNPLLNPGRQCPGGYAQECNMIDPECQQTYQYSNQKYKVQSLNQGLYHCQNKQLSDQKIKSFIQKHYFFPDKYRANVYHSQLGLPISKSGFRELERLGRHSCVKILNAKYPLDNLNLAEKMKDIVSLLAHYSPIFSENQLIPTIIFPFICIFGEDRFFCFEILYRLFNNWLSCLFDEFPLANSTLLHLIHQIFQQADQSILRHLSHHNISFTKLTWTLLSTFFATNLNRDAFLSIVDTLFTNPDDPSFLISILIGYILYNKSRILSMKSEEDLDTFLENQHTVNISKFMKKAYSIHEKYHKFLQQSYPFRSVNKLEREYISFEGFSSQALKNHTIKAKIQEQKYQQAMQEKKYHDQLTKEIDQKLTKVKKQAQKNKIKQQAVILQSDNERKRVFQYGQLDRNQRNRKMQGLVNKLSEIMMNQ